MGSHRNEKGYALLVVLLTITIIFSVSAVLASKTITSAKQIDYTDEYTRSIDLAEMGATYARTSIETSLQPSLDEAIANIDKDSYKDSNGDLNLSDYQGAVADEFSTNVITTVNSSEKHNVSYGINQYTTNVSLGGIDTADNSTIVTFHVNSTGDADINDVDSEYPVEFNLVVTLLGNLTGESGGSSSEGSSTGDLVLGIPDENIFKDYYTSHPIYNWDYVGYDGNSYNQKHISDNNPSGGYYQNGIFFDNGINDVTFTGDVGITGSQTFKDFENLTFENSLYSGNKITTNNSNVTVNGFATLGDGIILENNSIFTANDNLDLGVAGWGSSAELQVKDDSTLNVNGNLRVGNISLTSSTSKVNVDGDTIIKGNINSMSGEMNLKGNASYYGPLNGFSGKIIVYGAYDGTKNDKVKLMEPGSTPEDCVDDGYLYVLNGYTEGGDSSTDGSDGSGEINWDTDQNGIKYD